LQPRNNRGRTATIFALSKIAKTTPCKVELGWRGSKVCGSRVTMPTFGLDSLVSADASFIAPKRQQIPF
jgi:hypothetical protein